MTGMQKISVGMWEISVGIGGTWVEMRRITVGIQGIWEIMGGIRGVRVAMQGIREET